MALLEFRNLSVSFDTSIGLFKAVEGIDLSVDAREVLAIVGESGSGKSALELNLTLIDSPTAGELFIEGDKVEIARTGVPKQLRRKVQMVFQNPYGSLNPRQ